MALTFGGATTDRVNCGSGATLDSLNPLTVLAWVYPTTLTALREVASKRGAAAQDWVFRVADATDELTGFYSMSTGSFLYDTTDANITTNKWWLVAMSVNPANGAGDRVRVYVGDLATAARQCAVSAVVDTGSGTHDDAANNLLIGNWDGLDNAWQGRIACAAVFGAELTLAQVRSWQFHPRKMSGCVGLWHLGFNGTGTQPDLSGNFNAGTVTGASVGAHVPLRPLFGAAPGWRGAYTAPAASASFAAYYQQYYRRLVA